MQNVTYSNSLLHKAVNRVTETRISCVGDRFPIKVHSSSSTKWMFFLMEEKSPIPISWLYAHQVCRIIIIILNLQCSFSYLQTTITYLIQANVPKYKPTMERERTLHSSPAIFLLRNIQGPYEWQRLADFCLRRVLSDDWFHSIKLHPFASQPYNSTALRMPNMNLNLIQSFSGRWLS